MQNNVRACLAEFSVALCLGLFLVAGAQATILHDATPVSDGSDGDNTIAFGNTSRNLAVGADGTIYAVYRGSIGGIRVARSTDRGASFQPSVQVSVGDFEAEIAVSTTGVVYVVWPESGNAQISRSLDGGQSFSAPVTAGTTSDSSLHMATDANRVYIIGRSTTNVFVSADNGQTFTNTGPLTGGEVFSDVQVDSQTNEVVAILDNPTVKYFISSDFGQTWGAQQTPGGSIFYSTSAISSGSNGRFFLISGSGTNAYRVNLDTGTQTTLTFGDNSSAQGRSIAADRCGNVVDGYVASGPEVRYRISNDLGSTFGTETSVALSDAANVFINQTNGDILYLYDVDGKVFLSVFAGELGGCYVPELSSSSLVFSAQLVGQTSATQTVEIINSGGVDVEIQGITINGDFSQTSNCIGALAVGDSCPITADFTPTATGTRSGEILIDTNVFVDPRQVHLVGEGVDNAPVASFTPSSLDFDIVSVGQTATQAVRLENAGNETLTINSFSTASPFSFTNIDCGTSLAASDSCDLEVGFLPTSETVYSGSLTLDSNTSGAPPSVALTGTGVAPSFTVGGTVAGLEGSGLVLQNNGGDDLAISADGSFTFDTALGDGSTYDVNVLTQPDAPSQACSVSNGSGAVSGENVTDVVVSCTTDTFTVGGTVSGLESGGLVLQNNGIDDLTISADGSFAFDTALDDGSTYDVTVLTQPDAPSQTCSVSNGSGTMSGADVIDITVTCATLNVVLSTDNLNFGAFESGSQGERRITVSNIGGGDVTLVTVNGPQAPFSIVGGTCLSLPTTLARNESCSLTVRFDSTAPGSFSDTLEVENDANVSLVAILSASTSAIPVPVLSNTGLLLLALLMGLVALIGLRRFA